MVTFKYIVIVHYMKLRFDCLNLVACALFILTNPYVEASQDRITIKLKAHGHSPLNARNKNIDSETKVTVDGSFYTGGSHTFELIRFPKGVKKEMPKDVKFQSFKSYQKPSLGWLGNSIYLTIDSDPVSDPVSDLWFTFSPRSGTVIAKKTDIELNNGYSISYLGKSGDEILLGSPQLTCERKVKGNSLLYKIRWHGNDFNGDKKADVITIDIKVQGYTGVDYKYNVRDEAESSILAIGEEILPTENNGQLGVGEDFDLDATEALMFSVENVTVAHSEYVAKVTGFSSYRLDEIEGREHKCIRSQGVSDQVEVTLVHGPRTYNIKPKRSLLLTSAGSKDENGFNISALQFHIRVCDPNSPPPYDPTDYSDEQEGVRYADTYPVQEPGVAFPSFSWDKIPRWLAVRKYTAYTREELVSIAANYQLVMLEKCNVNGSEYTEIGTAKMAKELKGLNPNLKILHYWNADAMFPFYKVADEITDESWYTGVSKYKWGHSKDGNFPVYDSSNSNFRQWWASKALDLMDDPNIDGLFVDAVGRESSRFYGVNGKPSTQVFEMLDEVRRNRPPEKMLVVNALKYYLPNANRQFLECFDGAYLEKWNLSAKVGLGGEMSAQAIHSSIQYMKEALSRGKMINMQTWGLSSLGESGAQANVDFPLAVFLMVVEKNAFFGYQSGVNADPNRPSGKPFEHPDVWDTSFVKEFNRPLGEPLGPSQRDGDIYTRLFKYLKVKVNVVTGEVNFEWVTDADGDGLEDEWELEQYGSVFTKN